MVDLDVLLSQEAGLVKLHVFRAQSQLFDLQGIQQRSCLRHQLILGYRCCMWSTGPKLYLHKHLNSVSIHCESATMHKGNDYLEIWKNLHVNMT